MKKLLLASALSMLAGSASYAVTDGFNYEPKNSIDCINLWIKDRVNNPKEWFSLPISEFYNKARTACFATVDGKDAVVVGYSKTMVVGDESNDFAHLVVLDARTGDVMKTVQLTVDGEPIQGLLCANQVGCDQFGHVWFAGYVTQNYNPDTNVFTPIRIYKVDDWATGACSLQAELYLPEDEADATGRCDYYDLVGDITREKAPCTIMAANTDSPYGYGPRVLGWTADQGSDEWKGAMDGYTSVPIYETYPTIQAEWGNGPMVRIVVDNDFTNNSFYVDAFRTCPTLYSKSGAMLESFASVPDLAPLTIANGVCEFFLDGRSFIAYPITDYSIGFGCQIRVCELGEGRSFEGMESYWTLPENGLGDVTDGGNRIHAIDARNYKDEYGNEYVLLLTYKCNNGVGVYKISTTPDTPNTPAEPTTDRSQFAYNLKADWNEAANTFTFSFESTGDAAGAALVLKDNINGAEQIINLDGAVKKGANAYNVNATLIPTTPQNWSIRLQNYAITEDFVTEPVNVGGGRAGIATFVDPEFPETYGYVAIGRTRNTGIDVYNPAGELVQSAVFANCEAFGGTAVHNSSPMDAVQRGNEVYFASWGDDAYGVVAYDITKPSVAPYSVFDGTKEASGLITNAAGEGVGSGTPCVGLWGKGEETSIITFDEDIFNNQLAKNVIGTAKTTSKAAELVGNGFGNQLLNTNIGVKGVEGGIFVTQARQNGMETLTAGLRYILMPSGISVWVAADEAATNPNFLPSSLCSVDVNPAGDLLAISTYDGINVYHLNWEKAVFDDIIGNEFVNFDYMKPVLTPYKSIPYPFGRVTARVNVRFDVANNIHAVSQNYGYFIVTMANTEGTVVETPAPFSSKVSGVGEVVEPEPGMSPIFTEEVGNVLNMEPESTYEMTPTRHYFGHATGLQFDMTLPNGLSLTNVVAEGADAELAGLTAEFNRLANGDTRVMLYTTTGAEFGYINLGFTFATDANITNSEIRVHNTIFSINDKEVTAPDQTLQIVVYEVALSDITIEEFDTYTLENPILGDASNVTYRWGEVTPATIATLSEDGVITATAAGTGTYSLYVKAGNNPEARYTAALNVLAALMGDTDRNGVLNVADLVAMVNYILDRNPENFDLKRADMDRNGSINIVDVTMLIKQLLAAENIAVNAAKVRSMNIQSSSELSFGELEKTGDNLYSLPIELTPGTVYTALQSDIVLPSELSVVAINIDSQLSEHVLAHTDGNTSVARMLVYSLSLAELPVGERTVIANIVISGNLNEGDVITATDNIACDTEAEAYNLGIAQKALSVPTGVGLNNVDGCKAVVVPGGIRFIAPEGTNVKVTDMSGRDIVNTVAPATVAVEAGVYIVTFEGNVPEKVIVR